MSSAAWCERAAALASAGVSSARIADLLGLPPESVADGGAIRTAWALCVQTGAALAQLLLACAAAARDWERIDGERQAAVAGPRAAARLITVLPFAGVLLGVVLGLNPLAALFGGPLGWACLIIGSACMAASWRWTSALVRRAADAQAAPGFGCELLAQLVQSGIALPDARRYVDDAWPADRAEREAALQLSASVGMPIASVLRAESMAQRHHARALAQGKASELAVQLTVPLGVCVLPAFLAWSVIPLLLSVIATVHLGLPAVHK